MSVPRIAAIHDLSGFGRCSLTVAMPVLSAMGAQCCPLPTAFLSTHTGGFGENTFLDMTDELPGVMRHWSQLELRFQAIYSGFLGSEQQIDMVEQFLRSFRTPDTLVVIDPVMGDHGQLYRTYTPAMCSGMLRLAQRADVITPNLTEAALLLDTPYHALPHGDTGFLEIAERLSEGGRRSVVLTGASAAPQLTGAAYFDARTGKSGLVQVSRIPAAFPGTGDLFTSVLTGALCRGESIPAAAQLAADFVSACVRHTTSQNLPPREGVEFEPLLHLLFPPHAE